MSLVSRRPMYRARGAGPLGLLKLLALPRLLKKLFPNAMSSLDAANARSRREQGLGRRRKRGKGVSAAGRKRRGRGLMSL